LIVFRYAPNSYFNPLQLNFQGYAAAWIDQALSTHLFRIFSDGVACAAGHSATLRRHIRLICA
jgi:hypothetical protein